MPLEIANWLTAYWVPILIFAVLVAWVRENAKRQREEISTTRRILMRLIAALIGSDVITGDTLVEIGLLELVANVPDPDVGLNSLIEVLAKHAKA